MDDIINAVIEAVKHGVAKLISVGGTLFIFGALQTISSNPSAGVSVILAGGAYAVWTQVFIPAITGFLDKAMGKTTATKGNATSQYFALL